MSIVIDANIKLFAERMNITSSRMSRDYGLATVDEIIEKEAARGNSQAVDFAREYYTSPDKLIKVFNLTDVENKFRLLNNMDSHTRNKVLPMLENEDLVMGLYFFTKDKLLAMLMTVDIEELVRVIRETFPVEEIVMMFKEEDLAKFFMHDKLERYDVMEQIRCLPPEVMQKFIESVTGKPSYETSTAEFIRNIESMPTDQYRKFMATIDPDVQRQLTFQLIKVKPEYMNLFENEAYVNMLSTLMKPDMVKPMVMLNQETLVTMIQELPPELMSIVAAQVDTEKFAKFLLDGKNKELLERALLV